MITVEEASAIIQGKVKDFGTEDIPLDDSYDRILRETITADRDFPPFDRVTMDGIAIRYEQFKNGQRDFAIDGIAAAGAPQLSLEKESACLEVMTGAIMPTGVDTVIRYEDLIIQDGMATINEENIQEKQNVHFKGLDRKQGSIIIHPGKKISSAEIGTCATVGKSAVKVSKLPKTIVISSGDELVAIDQTPKAHQIRSSNMHTIKAVLSGFSIDCDLAHIADDYEAIVTRIEQYLQQYDLIILSGGVSMGKFDYLPKALDQLGVQKHFHKIKQRPGKPFWFGTHGEAVVFAFPGNPVSSYMCINQYLVPWLRASLRQEERSQPYAKLTENVTFNPDLTYFLEVAIDYSTKGELLATPVVGNGSGDLANLTDADAFIKLPMGRNEFMKGEIYPVIFYR